MWGCSLMKEFTFTEKKIRRILKAREGILANLRSAQEESLDDLVEVKRLITCTPVGIHLEVHKGKGTKEMVTALLDIPVGDEIYIPVCDIHTHILPGVIPSTPDLVNVDYRHVSFFGDPKRQIRLYNEPIPIITNPEGECFIYQQPRVPDKWRSYGEHQSIEGDLREEIKRLGKRSHRAFYERLVALFEERRFKALFRTMETIDVDEISERFHYSGHITWN